MGEDFHKSNLNYLTNIIFRGNHAKHNIIAVIF